MTLCSALCATVTPAGMEAVLKLGLVEALVEVLKAARDAPTRNNSAIALAKIAKAPGGIERVRAARGIEILMHMQTTGTKLVEKL